MTQESLKKTLLDGLNLLNLSISPTLLLDYLTLLIKWNKTYNLTAIRDPEEMVIKHLLDSLAIQPFFKGDTLLDVGTGAGLPGIPLAIANPDKMITLLDSNGKKMRFLHEVKRKLNLKNIILIESRVETYQPDSLFDVITSRAFSDIPLMIKSTKHLLKQNGQWLLMKGQDPKAELETICFPFDIKPYTLPLLENIRHCVIITKSEI